MAFTVLTSRMAQPGEGDTLIAAILAGWQASQRPHSRLAWVLQERRVRDHILVLSEWDDAQAFAQRPRVLESTPGLAQRVRSCSRLTLQRLHFFEDMGVRACTVTCHRLSFPPPYRGQVLRLLQEEKLPRLRALPALVLRFLYAVVDQPGQFVVVQGWTRRSAWAEAHPRFAPVMATAAAQFEWRDEQFVGRTRGEWDGEAHRWLD
jgi:hypothetical protein